MSTTLWLTKGSIEERVDLVCIGIESGAYELRDVEFQFYLQPADHSAPTIFLPPEVSQALIDGGLIAPIETKH